MEPSEFCWAAGVGFLAGIGGIGGIALADTVSFFSTGVFSAGEVADLLDLLDIPHIGENRAEKHGARKTGPSRAVGRQLTWVKRAG